MKVKSLEKYKKEILQMIPFEIYGQVTKLIGLTIESSGPFLKVGDLCRIEGQDTSLIAEVIGFKDNKLLLTALGDIKGIEIGAKVFPVGSSYAPVGEDFLGRVVNALGEPLDSKKRPKISDFYPLYGEPLKPLERAPINEVLDVGIKAINALLTIGRGQRVA
ncbi:MAG: flagellum-specific ATP synthase FliI, partial [Thermodesulfobacterium geofontis]